MVDLEQFRAWIADAWSLIFKFSLITDFYLTKSENKLQYYSHTFALSKGTIFAIKCRNHQYIKSASTKEDIF